MPDLEHDSAPLGEWQDISTAPEGVPVLTKIHDALGERNVQVLVKRTRIPGETRPLFWFEDGSMYVYYNPTHWMPRALNTTEGGAA